MTWLFCILTACNQENKFTNSFKWFDNDNHDTLIIQKPPVLAQNLLEPNFRYQLISDTNFVVSQDTFSFELYKDIQSYSDYYLNCFKNHIYNYSFIINPSIFKHILDSSLIAVTQISNPEILFFSSKYQKIFLDFNIGLPNQQAFNKGVVSINHKGKNWFSDIISNLSFNKYNHFISKDEEALLLGNYIIQLENEKITKIQKPFIFSGFLNSQAFFILDDPVLGDTFFQETIIDEWGNEKIEYYRVTIKDSIDPNLIIFNLNGDTLYKLRFDGICEDEIFGKQICFAKSDTLKIGVFYDFTRKKIRIFDLITLNQKIIDLKDLISDYPENLPFIDIPMNCYLQDSSLYRGEKKLRLFFLNNKPSYYLFLHAKN